MTPTKTKKEAEKIFERSMAAFGLSFDMHTDPTIMRSVLKEFRLDDFQTENAYMKTFFEEIASQPHALKPMFETIQKGIVSKHPAVVEFAEVGLQKKWFKKSKHVTRSVHVMCVLEALTASMSNDHDFFVEVDTHYKRQELKKGIDSRHLIKTFFRALRISNKNVFETMKSISIDTLMIFSRIQKGLASSRLKEREIQSLSKDKRINVLEKITITPVQSDDLQKVHELIRLNIYEAGITEYKHGLEDNAVCAHELCEDMMQNPPRCDFQQKHVIPQHNTNPFYDAITRQNTVFPTFEYSQEWVSLYTTWNMAFVVHNLDNLDIVLPKLFIPSIIDAERENFMGVRIISLWLTVNHVFLRLCDKKEIARPVHNTKMTQAWAAINKRYALALAQEQTHESRNELIAGYRTFYRHPLFNFLKLVRKFAMPLAILLVVFASAVLSSPENQLQYKAFFTAQISPEVREMNTTLGGCDIDQLFYATDGRVKIMERTKRGYVEKATMPEFDIRYIDVLVVSQDVQLTASVQGLIESQYTEELPECATEYDDTLLDMHFKQASF